MDKLKLAILGAIGSISPDILILYSKRFSMKGYEFSPSLYIYATLLYMLVAAVVAFIFPYGSGKKEWKAFGVGFALPVILGGIVATVKPTVITPRGDVNLTGTLTDLMSLF